MEHRRANECNRADLVNGVGSTIGIKEGWNFKVDIKSESIAINAL